MIGITNSSRSKSRRLAWLMKGENSLSPGRDTNQVRLPGRSPEVVQGLEINSATICLCRELKFNYSPGPGKLSK